MTDYTQVHAAQAGTVIRVPAWKGADGVWICANRTVIGWYIRRKLPPAEADLEINPITQEGIWYRSKWPFAVGKEDRRTNTVHFELLNWDGRIFGNGYESAADEFLLASLEVSGWSDREPYSPKRELVDRRMMQQGTQTDDLNEEQ